MAKLTKQEIIDISVITLTVIGALYLLSYNRNKEKGNGEVSSETKKGNTLVLTR